MLDWLAYRENEARGSRDAKLTLASEVLQWVGMPLLGFQTMENECELFG